MAARAQVQSKAVENLPTAVDIGEIARRRRLQRALAEPNTFEEFLDDPQAFARRFDVTLTPHEAAAAERARRLAFEWDRTLGSGRWLEAIANPDRRARRIAASESLDETIARALRDWIGAEIIEDIPEAFRRAADTFGAEPLVRSDDPAADLPPRARPLRRVAREIARRVTRELERELDSLAFRDMLTPRRRPAQEPLDAEPAAAMDHAGADIRIQALRRHIADATTRAIEEAIERIGPAMPAHEPRHEARPIIEAVEA